MFRTGYERCPADGGELVALDGDPLLGVELAGRYVLEELVGQGSMGLIYRARHVALPRRFAVKILFGDLVVDPRMRIRFAQEAALASRLGHPNVVPVVDFGRTDSGLLYLVMDFVEGEGLGEVLAREGALEPRAAIRLVRQLAQGLGHAHRRGLVHRDFKPGNVLLEPQEDGAPVPRILDFGLAISTRDRDENPCRLTELGLVIGTPIYIAPEQVLDLAVDHRADLFALGVVLYEMLAGRPPFDGRPVEIAHKNVLHPVPAIAARSPGIDVPPALEALAARLLAKSPGDRYGSADELVGALDVIDGELARRGRRARTMSVPSIEEDAPAARLDAAEAARPPARANDRAGQAVRDSRGVVVLPPRAEPAPGLDSLTGQERIAPVRGVRPLRRARRGTFRRGLAVGGAVLFAGAVGFYAAASQPAPASARSSDPAAGMVAAADAAGARGAGDPEPQARSFQPAPPVPRALESFASQADPVDGEGLEAPIRASESMAGAAAPDAVGHPVEARSGAGHAARASVRGPASAAAAAERRIASSAGAAAPSSAARSASAPTTANAAISSSASTPANAAISSSAATPANAAISSSAATPANTAISSSAVGSRSAATPASAGRSSNPSTSASAARSASAPMAPSAVGPSSPASPSSAAAGASPGARRETAPSADPGSLGRPTPGFAAAVATASAALSPSPAGSASPAASANARDGASPSPRPAAIAAPSASAGSAAPTPGSAAPTPGSAAPAPGSAAGGPAGPAPGSARAITSAAAALAPRPREPIAVPPGRAKRVGGSLPAVAFPRWERAPGAIAARLCIDAHGAVTRVAVVAPVSSGVRAELERAMSTWRYRPILDGGRPVPACFATRFRVQVE